MVSLFKKSILNWEDFFNNEKTCCAFLQTDCELRRLKLIEACAYYVLLKGITVDQLEMNDDLASLITERLHAANLDWSIGGKTRYSKLLDDAMQETCKYPNLTHIYSTTIGNWMYVGINRTCFYSTRRQERFRFQINGPSIQLSVAGWKGGLRQKTALWQRIKVQNCTGYKWKWGVLYPKCNGIQATIQAIIQAICSTAWLFIG